MAKTVTSVDLQVERWTQQFYINFVRDSGFSPYIGTGANALIKTQRELLGKGGKSFTVPLVKTLDGRGKGTAQLTGNEARRNDFAHTITPYWVREAVVTDQQEQSVSAYDMYKANEDVLGVFFKDRLRDDIIEALGAVVHDTALVDFENSYGAQRAFGDSSVSDAQLDAYMVSQTTNARRIMFGNDETGTNDVAGDFLATMATVNTTAGQGRINASAIRAMKRVARKRNKATGQYSIRPYKISAAGAREYFVMFVGPQNFGRLKEDADIKAANLEGRVRGVSDHPVFQDGDLLYDGIMIHEIPEIEEVAGVGASSANVEPVYLCGAEALCHGVGDDFKATSRKEDDYQFISGVGGQEKRTVEKMFFDGVQHGVLTGYFA